MKLPKRLLDYQPRRRKKNDKIIILKIIILTNISTKENIIHNNDVVQLEEEKAYLDNDRNHKLVAILGRELY